VLPGGTMTLGMRKKRIFKPAARTAAIGFYRHPSEQDVLFIALYYREGIL